MFLDSYDLQSQWVDNREGKKESGLARDLINLILQLLAYDGFLRGMGTVCYSLEVFETQAVIILIKLLEILNGYKS